MRGILLQREERKGKWKRMSRSLNGGGGGGAHQGSSMVNGIDNEDGNEYRCLLNMWIWTVLFCSNFYWTLKENQVIYLPSHRYSAQSFPKQKSFQKLIERPKLFAFSEIILMYLLLRWESGYEKTWESIQEDNEGMLDISVKVGGLQSYRQRREKAAEEVEGGGRIVDIKQCFGR